MQVIFECFERKDLLALLLNPKLATLKRIQHLPRWSQLQMGVKNHNAITLITEKGLLLVGEE